LQRVVVEALPAAAVGHGNLLKNDKWLLLGSYYCQKKVVASVVLVWCFLWCFWWCIGACKFDSNCLWWVFVLILWAVVLMSCEFPYSLYCFFVR
jgi:hypothetical protein